MPHSTDILIIGQGICGTFLHYELGRAGLSSIVIDEARPFSASRAAAGLINPVTGRRLVTTWMIEELLPFARQAYAEIGQQLGVSCIREVKVVDFFPTVQMRQAFLQRYEEDRQYLELPADEGAFGECWRYELGYGLINPCYLVDMQGLLQAARREMRERGCLREEKFEREELVVGGGVLYRDIIARWIIFCDGIESFENPYFARLPFAPNKGEALIVEIQGLENCGPGKADAGPEGGNRGVTSGNLIFKKGISLVPWREGLYWAGSSYEWSFTDGLPTEVFRERTEAALREWLRVPFRTVEHFASVRPATLERRPFVGLHPRWPAVGILNGMGTKGCSLAPYFARQLAYHLATGSSIRPDADILRFSKVLSRG